MSEPSNLVFAFGLLGMLACKLFITFFFDSSLLWIKWHLGPYGQKPVVWKVRQSSVLYFGCRWSVLSSLPPCANWHLSPYLHVPFSSKGLHNSVLYRDELACDLPLVEYFESFSTGSLKLRSSFLWVALLGELGDCEAFVSFTFTFTE